MNLSKEVLNLPIESIAVNPNQPRKVFDGKALFELADSIARYGVMQPITVRKAAGGGYELIAGERRLRASGLAGLKHIPAIIAATSDEDSAVLALIENLQRADLNYIEEAEALSRVLDTYGFTQERLAKTLGKSQSSVCNKLRLLKLPDDIKRDALSNGLSERHLRALLTLRDEQKQRDALSRVVKGGMTVQATERLVAKMAEEEKRVEPRRQFIVRDLRVFTNTIKKAVTAINECGAKTTYDMVREGNECRISIVVSV